MATFFRLFISSIETFSSTLCISFPTKPNSTTGQISLINLASEVPPLVDKIGKRPVVDFIALFNDSTK